MQKPIPPRDRAGSFTLPSTKSGEIAELCGVKDFLEVYTPHETFKLQTPENVDPERTNPNAPWVRVKTHDVGSGSPFVARTFITAYKMLKQSGAMDEVRTAAALSLMHDIKETLLQCSTASEVFCTAVDEAMAAVDASGFKRLKGVNSLEVFPMVQDINGKVTAFLISARRAITEICQISPIFWEQGRSHSALEHLLEKELTPKLGADHLLVQFLQKFAPGTKRIVELRNGQEHSQTTKSCRLEIRNFEHVPNGQIRAPVWFLDGEEPQDICAPMKAIPMFLLDLAEGMFVGALAANLPKWPPFIVHEIEEPALSCPVRYQLMIDTSGFILKD